MSDIQPTPTTTGAGIPVESDDHSLTIGEKFMGFHCLELTTAATQDDVCWLAELMLTGTTTFPLAGVGDGRQPGRLHVAGG